MTDDEFDDTLLAAAPLELPHWRLARSLGVLRDECNAYAPHRKKTADGTIGNAAHAARASRHNPNNAGVVCALDITHDPAGGMDTYAVARRLVLHPHPDLCYIISNRQISSRPDWKWLSYSGTSPHTGHMHVAVGVGPDSEPRPPYDDTMPWGVSVPLPVPDKKYPTTASLLDGEFLQNSVIDGQDYVDVWRWYGIPVIYVLTITMLESSCGKPGSMAVKNNSFFNIKAGSGGTWEEFSDHTWHTDVPGGGTFLGFATPALGMAAGGRYLKVGPSRHPGYYLGLFNHEPMDWVAFTQVFNPGGGTTYAKKAKDVEALFRARAASFGYTW